MKTEENKFLGSEKISKLLFRFSIPCILSLLISSLYNIVDQIFIGNSNLGYLGNAAPGGPWDGDLGGVRGAVPEIRC